ncbi:MAG TPA: UDP-N-acetylmuramoyl-L-alanine--D-glutamate ligase [Candidatus Krumholzibacteria bacterium]|nr:UDP-N-acetylmuramoyl-L-alanine--D-glutamate ligase [Candidatus Krumholzibacteria bacterium]
MKPFAQCSRFLVLGMARSGIAVSGLLAGHGHAVQVSDDDAAALHRFAASDVAREFGARIAVVAPQDAEAAVAGVDCVVPSPGVPLEHRVIRAAYSRDVRVAGEIEVAAHYTRARIVGVTGTNGKSTTVGIIGGILAAAGVDVVVAGNIGTPLADVLRERDHHTLVLELSSFQLDTVDEFRVQVAVLLNVTPDHLDRYGQSLARYEASKARILNRADDTTWFVYNADDAAARRIAQGHRGPVVAFSSTQSLDQGVYWDGTNIVRAWDGERSAVIRRAEFMPVGVHNLENAMAAIGAAIPLGIELDGVRAALRSYRPLPHRMELVRVVDGVAYVNDSKATNVDATVKSLMSVDGPVIVILGGRDKDGDFAPLAERIGAVKRVVLIGEARAVIRKALAGRCEMTDAGDMREAVAVARGAAAAGDTVLLAPACASFDMFRNYQHRGEVFRECVNSL